MASQKPVNPRRQWLENFKALKAAPPQEYEFIGSKLNSVIQDIRAQIPEDVMTEFEHIKTDEKRMSFLLELDPVHQILAINAGSDGKSASNSQQYRKDGNKLFQSKSYRQAVDKYSEAIRHAPWRTEHVSDSSTTQDVGNGLQNGLKDIDSDDDNQLALALANRSAALFHMKEYDLCLRDIEEALGQGYSKNLQYKLFDRKGKCYRMKNDKIEAVKNYQIALEHLEWASVDDKGRNLWTASLTKQMKLCDQLPDSPSNYVSTKDHGFPQVTGELHSVYSNASKALDLGVEDKKGKFFRAERNIHVGDVIMSEQPYSSVVYPQFRTSVCYHCCCRLLAPLPCQKTSSVVFCSIRCRDTAWQTYHKAEALFLDLLDHSWCGSSGIGHLVVRTVIVTGFKELVDQLTAASRLTDQVLPKGVSQEGHYEVDKFSTVYVMEDNLKERTPEGLFDFAVYAAFLMKILQAAGVINGHNVDEGEIGGCLLHLLQVVQCNAYPIYEVYNTTDFENLCSADIGLGMYPTAALFNHSCDPNCDITFYGNKSIIRATRNISKGEDVVVSYAGQVFYKVPLHSRRAKLQFHYSFHCECRACVEDWPLGEDLPCDVPRLRCTDCQHELVMSKIARGADLTHVRCENRKCNSLQDLNEGMERLKVLHDVYGGAMEEAAAGRFSQAIPGFQDYLTLMQKYICPPWKYITACQVAICHCYRVLANSRLNYTVRV